MSSVPFRVKAVYEYSSGVDDDLNFPNGQIITVTDQEEEDWYTGEYVDPSGSKKGGMFPRNFVERYEPQTPPRPSRTNRSKKEPEPSLPVEAVKALPTEQPPDDIEEEVEPAKPAPSKAEPPNPPPVAQRKHPEPQSQAAAPPPVARSASGAAKPPPPAVAEKPNVGSFRDRIAAFNKPAAAPIAPFKPGASGGTGFIKKPFVAPPPSKDAYVHQPREPPPKVYHRDEDPEVTEVEQKEIQATPMAAAAATNENTPGEAEEDQPKPTSLKERIALLQKQQLEQASRHAEVVQKKEKPKRPPKKRTESHEPQEPVDSEPAAGLEKLDSHEKMGKSMDDSYEEVFSAPPKPPARTKSSHDSYIASPPQPARELVSDTNDADNSGAGDTEETEETSTSKDDSDERPRPPPHAPRTPAREEAPEVRDDGSNGDEEEEDDIDPEVKRRMELRERMAKMSGGYGMMGMFGPPGGGAPSASPKKPKAIPGDSNRNASGGQEKPDPATYAPPVPIMQLPGMGRLKSPEQEPEVEREEDESEDELPITSKHDTEDMPDIEEVETAKPAPPRQSLERGAPPRIPSTRSAPAPPPIQARVPPPVAPREPPLPTPTLPESRPAPPPPPRGVKSPDQGEESDDELSLGASRRSLTDNKEAPSENRRAVPSIPIPGPSPVVPSRPREPKTPTSRPNPLSSPTTPGTTGEKNNRASRVPPIPLASPIVGSPTQSRPPPPPPPGEPPSRRSTMESKGSAPSVSKHPIGADSDEETTEYDGDYDTDIASGVKHKDALKAHARDSSLDEGTITDEPLQSPVNPSSARLPPLPPTAAPRAVPPLPPPSQPKSRKSTDIPRGAPPPVPPTKDHSQHEDDNEYDSHNYTRSAQPILESPSEEPEEDDLYDATPVPSHAPPPPDRNIPALPPPSSQPMNAPPPIRGPPRQSSDLPPSQPPMITRRSMDAPRPSAEHGFIASDVDLSQSTIWWSQPECPPPVFQNRRDLLYEIEDNSETKRGGKKTISRDVYAIFMDYSQTIINVRFDALIPKDVLAISQRHEPPPTRLRQDQLENAHAQFGARIAEAMTVKQSTTIGDGTPQSLILDLLSQLPGALHPIGTRAYGALVYANLANASTMQFDEIRPGDVVTFRNAKFQGHRGAMHQKYSSEVGKPDHVAIVVDWDGTKKKVRAWEQGREGRKVKIESFKLGELRSGECRVWRVMGREWVGWDDGKKG